METQLTDEEFCISLLINDSENHDQTLIISDDKFAQELQLQEVIVSSFISLQINPYNQINCSPQKSPRIEIGESSKMGAEKKPEEEEEDQSTHSLCEICAEKKHSEEMFPLQDCSHSFCKDCISKHISIKIKKRASQNGAVSAVACPGISCTAVLEYDKCIDIVREDVVSMWADVLCESAIWDSEKLYCPYKDCSELFLVNENGGEEIIREAECPFCRRLFCASCGVPWHSGVDCEEFLGMSEKERGREDLMVHELAKENKWKRCVKCKFFVERNQGCLHMTCRCGFEFCYACGKAWSSTHGGCQ